MAKLLLFVLFSTVFTVLTAAQYDQEIAMHVLFQAKHAVNRAAHAAAHQVDGQALARGERRIDPELAEQAALDYLRANLRLDQALMPLPGSFYRSKVEVQVIDIVDADYSFPYEYRLPELDYAVTLQRPGVVLVIRLEYPATYSVLGPIVWHVKGSAQLVY